MIDYFAIGLTHGLLALAALRLLARADLDEDEGTAKPVKPWLKNKRPRAQAPAPEASAEQGFGDA